MTRIFPPGFLWGVTTGAHQTEGNNLASDWWASETAPDTTIDEPSGDAADSYHRWREDMDLAAAAGFTDYRFGIEWSRVEPADGRISHAAVAHYLRMVTGAIERGLRPLPTLHHFTNPLWFTLGGGWSRRDAVERFLRYVDALTPVLGAGVERVETINEPNIYASLESLRAPGAGSLAQGLPVPDPAVTQAMIAVHRATRARLKERHPLVLTGWGVSVQDYQAEPGAENVLARYVHSRDEIFLEAARDDDWVGVQAYTRGRIAVADGEPTPVHDRSAPRTQTGWEDYPAALGGAVRRAARVVGKVPIIVTENGIATADDARRIAFTAEALDSLRAALDYGVDVRGYLHWSLLDNYEWGTYRPTFGLIAVDRVSFQRTPKPSLAWLGAQRSSWLREVMPSLVKTLRRWYWTVCALMNRRVPISGLDSPSRASRAIWASWAVSSSCLAGRVRLRAVAPAACSSRLARSANPAAPMAANIWCAVRSCPRASIRRFSRRSHSP